MTITKIGKHKYPNISKRRDLSVGEKCELLKLNTYEQPKISLRHAANYLNRIFNSYWIGLWRLDEYWARKIGKWKWKV